MASFTRCTMIVSADLRSLAAFTSWTILRSVLSMARGRLLGRSCVSGSVPRQQARCKFLEGAAIDLALECHHLAQRVPVAHPAPAVELRLAGQVHPHALLVGGQAQEKPLLLLADTQRLAVGAHQPLRQTIT